jgi:hypothetical protein
MLYRRKKKFKTDPLFKLSKQSQCTVLDNMGYCNAGKVWEGKMRREVEKPSKLAKNE